MKQRLIRLTIAAAIAVMVTATSGIASEWLGLDSIATVSACDEPSGSGGC